MDTVKINKHGRILIPASKRKEYDFFPGKKFQISVSKNEIILKPYNYICSECGEEIKDGSTSHFCEKCQEKYMHHVY